MVDENRTQEPEVIVQAQEQEQSVPAQEVKPQRSLVLLQGGALAPTNFSEMLEVARAIAFSGMVPKDYVKNAGAVLVAMEMGAELGLAPMQALQNISVINGRSGLWGDAVKALVISDPRCEDFAETASPPGEPPKWARCVIKRKGKTPTDVTFTVDDAKTAQLWGKSGVWSNYPRRMLQMRARSFACRDAFPDKLRGISMVEELQDIQVVDGGVPEYATPADIPEGTHKLSGSRKQQSKPSPEAGDPPGMDPVTGEVPQPEQSKAAVSKPKPQAKPSPQVVADPKAGF